MSDTYDAIKSASEKGDELSATVTDAPGLYWLGLQWLNLARDQYDAVDSNAIIDESDGVEVQVRMANRLGEMVDQRFGHMAIDMAQACFAGVHAAVALAEWSKQEKGKAPYNKAAQAAEQLLRNGQLDAPHPALADVQEPVHPALAEDCR